MKTHFGFISISGGYEEPEESYCDQTACGCTGEEPTMNATDDWELVDCKKCLRLKDSIIKGEKDDETAIVEQMGDFVDFQNKTGRYAKENV